MLVHLHHDLLDRPKRILIDEWNMVSVNGGEWHGEATYVFHEDTGGQWTLAFDDKGYFITSDAVSDREVIHLGCQGTVFTQIYGTRSFLNHALESGAYSRMLIPRVF